MKVLFAVSSENISEAIIKKYQKQYKEILSYKNVYYFNAILKEIQKDKTYDRIIISEDLEPFSNNNYDTIDKFIFEKLDSISDEAQDSSGKETSIILICTDRRQKGNSILVKLFGIGVYNALLGNDRSMEEVCKLINRPRTKKEAKMYYRIDTDDVNYKAENENEVSEVEIQNILAHFKKLGKNTAKYSDSFNNIAIQYNDEQLKIIVNCLPINVKAVLETNCERYQELMAVTGGITSVKNMAATTENIENAVKSGIKSRNVGQAGNITKPIVIPSAVKNAKNKAQVLKRPAPSPVKQQPVVQNKVQEENRTQAVRVRPTAPVEIPQVQQPVVEAVEEQDSMVSQTSATYQRPRRPVPGASRQIPQAPVQQEQISVDDIDDEDNLLPGFEDVVKDDAAILPGMEENNFVDDSLKLDILEDENPTILDDEEDSLVKRGRGRPRKTPVEGAVLKPKGKRGRPRKIQESEDIDEGTMLPGMEFSDEDAMLPGMEVEEENNFNYDEPIEDTFLPGFEEDNEISDDATLPGIEETEEYDSEEATVLPGMGFEDETTTDSDDYTEEVDLPGLEGLDDLDDLDSMDSSSLDYEENDDTELLPGLDNDEKYETIEDSSDILPGIGDNNYDDSEEELLPGIEDFEDKDLQDDGVISGIESFEDEDLSDDGLLPGIGNFEEESTNSIQSPTVNSNVVESIKPRVDYSMSSLNSLITKDKKIVTFIGTSKNGVSFLVNNLAALFSSLGINTAILDMTQNKNSYYIYTKNEDELRNIAFNSIEKLQNGYAEGIRVDKNLTVYTALPNDGKDYSNAEPILSTLIQNHSLVLIDCDYDTDLSYFASCQEMYLVQSMDILTIQPLTAFLRDLKTKGILEPEKIRVVINKELKVRSLSIKAIIGGLSYYNDPAMSFMTELFNKDMVKACTLPFEDNAYSKYLEGIVNCNISIKDFSRPFMQKLKVLGDMVYPLTSKQTYGKGQTQTYNPNAFSNSMNDTLNKMRKKY